MVLAEGEALLGARGSLLGTARPAWHAAGLLGLFPGHRLQVLIAEEPDQDAVSQVVAGDAGHYRDGAVSSGGCAGVRIAGAIGRLGVGGGG
jgi:hypothetical protein